jgi:head-tail adaptor
MENKINIGELDTKVTLLQCVISYNSQSAKKYAFTEHSKVFAKVDRSVSESVTNTNLEQGVDVSLTIYKVADLTTRWRVVIEGKTYAITGIDPISRVSPLCVLSLNIVE